MAADSSSPLKFFTFFILGSIALVVFIILLLLGLTVVGSMATGLGATSGAENVTSSPNPETGTAVSFASTAGNAEIHDVWSVNDSTGYGIELTGADDSFVKSDTPLTIAQDDTWSVSTWAQANASQTMAAVSLNGRVIIQYNHSQSEWRGWYYDDGTGYSYIASVTAPDQPGNLSLVTVTRNSTHMYMYANTTRGTAVNVTVSNVAELNTSATNWNGTLDETRVFDDTTGDTEQATLYNNPVAPRPGRPRTARIMYDEGSGASTDIYFSGRSATISNGAWVRALPGNALSEGVDYDLNENDGTITALAGGRIDGAPVVWIDYNYAALNRIGELARTFEPAFALFGSAALVIPAIVVLVVLIGGLVYGTKFHNRASGAFDDFGDDGR